MLWIWKDVRYKVEAKYFGASVTGYQSIKEHVLIPGCFDIWTFLRPKIETCLHMLQYMDTRYPHCFNIHTCFNIRTLNIWTFLCLDIEFDLISGVQKPGYYRICQNLLVCFFQSQINLPTVDICDLISPWHPTKVSKYLLFLLYLIG